MELMTRDEIDYRVAGHTLNDIVNYNEIAVTQIMRELFAKNLSLCQCRFCVEDVYALSLNALPARYIQPTSLEIYRTSPFFIDLATVREKVAAAIESVSAKPNHDQ